MKQNSISGMLIRCWKGFPLVFRSLITGFIISSVGVFTWGAMLYKFPHVLVVLPMIIILWVYWKYFDGSWGSKRFSLIRKERFRKTQLKPAVWKWGITGALFFVIILQSSFVITFRLIPFPAKSFMSDYKLLDRFPYWQAWVIVIMSSVVAGICEETGFRGYMQAPLEKKQGFVKANIITSLAFTCVHLGHNWAYPILPHIFFASILLGLLAFRTGSLLPGMIGHSILDVFDYSFWWTGLTGGFTKKTIFITGIDLHFIIWILVFLFALLGFFRMMRKLNRGSADIPTFAANP
jgi:membrane protease YdiL (CAAX protease family)